MLDKDASSMSVTPIFIFSLPRSGSTLLQKMIATHEQVATAPEPWILIPVLGAIRTGGQFSENSHSMTSQAIQDFIQKMPAGMDDYHQAVRSFVISLYEKKSGNAKYFLDKTPRYHVYADEIIRIFPEGKFIFLFRHPLAVFASILETWRAAHLFRYDLYTGLPSLIDASEKNAGSCLSIRYEELIENPEKEISKICDYLEIEYDARMVADYQDEFIRLGDFGAPASAGDDSEVYQKISTKPLNKWKKSIGLSPLRKIAARRFLSRMGSEQLGRIGYDYDRISQELQEVRPGLKKLGSDLMRLIRGFFSAVFETYFWRQKFKKVKQGSPLYPHQ